MFKRRRDESLIWAGTVKYFSEIWSFIKSFRWTWMYRFLYSFYLHGILSKRLNKEFLEDIIFMIRILFLHWLLFLYFWKVYLLLHSFVYYFGNNIFLRIFGLDNHQIQLDSLSMININIQIKVNLSILKSCFYLNYGIYV